MNNIEKQVKNPTVQLEKSKYADYLEAQGLSHSPTIDNRCRIVNLTDAAMSVKSVVFNGKPKDIIETFILSNHISILSLYENRESNDYVEIQDFYFVSNKPLKIQDIMIKDFKGLSNLHIRNLHFICNNTCERLVYQNLFNDCIIDKVYNCIEYSVTLDNCFNGTEIREDDNWKFKIEQRNVIGSFRNSRFNIKLSNHTRVIANSFRDIDKKYSVDISDMHASTIISSFVNIGKLIFVSMRNTLCDVLVRCSFNLCNGIEDCYGSNILDLSNFIHKRNGIINVDKNVTSIDFYRNMGYSVNTLINQLGDLSHFKYKGAFEYSSKLVNELVIATTNDLKDIEQTIKLPDGIKKIDGGYLRSFRGNEKVIFPDSIEILDRMENLSGNIVELNLPTTITRISQFAFRYSAIEEFDTIKFPRVKEIYLNILESSEVNTIIFRDNIIELKDEGLSVLNCTELRYLVLGRNIENCTKYTIKKICGSIASSLTIFVVKNSKSHLSLLGNEDYELVVVDSVEDAVCMIKEKKALNKEAENKIQRLIKMNQLNKKYEVFLEKRFIDRIYDIQKLIKDITNTNDGSEKKVKLNKEKFNYTRKIIKPIQIIEKHKELYKYKVYNGVENIETRKIPNKIHKNMFNSLSNLLTLLSNESLKDISILNNSMNFELNIIYNYNNHLIFLHTDSITNKNTIVIVINDNVCFIGNINMNTYIETIKMTNSILEIFWNEQYETSKLDYIKEYDIIVNSFTKVIRVSGLDIPYEFSEKVTERLIKPLCLIGQLQYSEQVVFMDILNQKFIVCECTDTNLVTSGVMTDIQDITVASNQFSIEQFKKQYMDRIILGYVID